MVSALSKTQRLCLLDPVNPLDAGKCRLWDPAVDLHQSDGGAALPVAAEGESRDVDSGVAEQAGEASDETGPVLIADVDHRWREFRVHFDVLDHCYAGLAIMKDCPGDG